ncbi:hypothetical protein ASF22_03450 [Methylobacterium sp. Leaf87]|uniref:hypothetical protein n=1 Tax=Methylobacterium sp. Leaf87 TaxID=1736243 RepID=UPI0006F845A0|nr:hypothetical protein [Methylobacterium sp. Leaf87]KQO69659.1 hypothetical protein ASF22_03450 [Methylobacterium sp. Leaf87]
MLSWVPSIFKRFTGVQQPSRPRSMDTALLPAILRIGNRTYACDIVGQVSDKTLVNLRRDVVIGPNEAIDIKLDRDRTYRRFSVRWKHGLQISVQPITSWAAPKAQTS